MKTLFAAIAIFSSTAMLADAQCELCAAKANAGQECVLTQTLSDYFALQKALANDDFAAAKKAVGALNASQENMVCSVEGKDCCAELKSATTTLSSAETIESARQSFKALSNVLIAQLEASGSSGDSPIYKMHCPMAFGNTGGTWLQDSDDLRNPYYGAMMLKCGMPQAVIGKKE